MTDHWQVIESALRERHERLLSTLDRWQEGSVIYERRLTEANVIDAALAFVREQRQLAAHPDAGEWTDAEYNDIINVDNHAQLRIVIDQSDKPDGKVHIHVRKRIVGEWAHVCVTTLKPEWRIQRRKQEGD
jgi:hypothetical protein